MAAPNQRSTPHRRGKVHKNLYPTLLTWMEPTKCLRRVFWRNVSKSWKKVTCQRCLDKRP